MMGAAEMAEMVRVLVEMGVDAQGIAQACARVAAAGKVQEMQSASPAKKRSASAIRMARMRARKKGESVTGDVTRYASPTQRDGDKVPETQAVSAAASQDIASQKASPNVTSDVTRYGRGKKEKSPTPPKEKTTPLSPKGGFPPASQPVLDKVRVHRDDPLFAEIAALRGVPVGAMAVSDRGGDWWFAAAEVQRARNRRKARDGPVQPVDGEIGLISGLEVTN